MTSEALPWKPPSAADVEALPVGRWWDAVRVTPVVGDRALKLLGDTTGAVIQDGYTTLYWLIAVGSAKSWHLRQVHVLTKLADEDHYLGVPPVHWTTGPGTHWRVPLGRDRFLTDTRALWDALAEAVRTELRTVPEGRQLCYRCQLPTDEPIPLTVEHSGSVASPTIYVCPRHAPRYRRDQS